MLQQDGTTGTAARGNVIRRQIHGTIRGRMMSDFTVKAIIYKDPENVYGPCGCGMDLATLPVLLPRDWLLYECPFEVNDHEFCRGFDYRRIEGFSCSRVFDHKVDGVEFLANFSCCRECAERAVKAGYAIMTEKEYPMMLR